jgi:hypothetical protein
MANKNIELYYQHRPVLDLAALKAIDTTNAVGGVIVNVTHEGPFLFHDTSTAPDDGINIIQPTVGPGRFIREGMYLFRLTSARKIDPSIMDTPFPLIYGGTGSALTARSGGIFYSTDTAGAIIFGTDTAGRMLQSGAYDAPTWSRVVYPATTVYNQILYSDYDNQIAGINAANSSILVSNSSGVPAFSTVLPSMTGRVVTSDSTQSTTVGTGSFVTAGGLGVAKDSYFGGIGNFVGRVTAPYVTLPNAPSAGTDAANKDYVDGAVGVHYWVLNTDTLNPAVPTWNVTTQGRITAATGTITTNPLVPTDIANKAYVDQTIGGNWELVGDTVYPSQHGWNVATLGRISATQGTMTAEPTMPSDIATKYYVDTRAPGQSQWFFDPDNNSIQPNSSDWLVKVGLGLQVGINTNNTEIISVLSPLGSEYTAMGTINNGSYNVSNDTYTFRVGLNQHIAGLVSIYTGGDVYQYAYNAQGMFDQTISATDLYTGYVVVPGTMFFSTYEHNINADYGSGTRTAIAFGGAAVLNDRLNLSHGDIRYITYDATSNVDFTQTGTVRFKVIPNYSGAPQSAMVFFSIGLSTNPTYNLITLFHSPNGYLYLYINASNGDPIVDKKVGLWAPVRSTTYEIELDMDLVGEVTRLFIGGRGFGGDIASIGIRTTQIDELIVGNYVGLTPNFVSNFSIMDLVVYNTVQHVADYTPGYDLISSHLKYVYSSSKDRFTYCAPVEQNNVLVSEANGFDSTASLSVNMSGPLGSDYACQGMVLGGYYDNLTSSYNFVPDADGFARGFVTLHTNGRRYEYSYSAPASETLMVPAGDLYAGWQVPDSCTFFISYNNSINANFSLSDPVGHSYGGAAVSGAMLDLAHDDFRYVYYDAYLNADFINKGTIKFSLKPTWTSTHPVDKQTYFYTCSNLLIGSSCIAFYTRKDPGSGNSEFIAEIYSSVGVLKAAMSFGTIVFAPDRFYDIELNLDFDTSTHRLFVGGAQQGTTQTGIAHDRTATDVMYIGNYLYTNPEANLTFAASYDFDITADYAAGEDTGTPYGGAAVANHKLDLAHDDNRYVTYPAALNAAFTQTCSIQFLLTPAYSGSPTADFGLFGVVESPDSTTNWVALYHNASTGKLLLTVYDSSHVYIIDPSAEGDLGVWSPTAGTEYAFHLNIDLTAGETKLYIDQVQKGSTITETGTRTATAALLVVGRGRASSVFATNAKYRYFRIFDLPQSLVGSSNNLYQNNFYLRDMTIFNNVQHTAAFTPLPLPGLHSNLVSIFDQATNTLSYECEINPSVDTTVAGSATDSQLLATTLPAKINVITSGLAVKLPPASTPGQVINIIVHEDVGASISVYPQVSEYINGTLNKKVTVTVAGNVTCTCILAGYWYATSQTVVA